MNPSASHQELQDLLPAVALETIHGADRELVLAHVRGCQECARKLEEYREATSFLALALPSQTLDPGRAAVLRTRLLSRARQEPELGMVRTTEVLPVPRRSSRAILLAERWSGWMVAAGLAGLLFTHHALHRPLDYGWLVAALLAVALVVLGLYARVQRKRLSGLLKRLGESDRSGTS